MTWQLVLLVNGKLEKTWEEGAVVLAYDVPKNYRSMHATDPFLQLTLWLVNLEFNTRQLKRQDAWHSLNRSYTVVFGSAIRVPKTPEVLKEMRDARAAELVETQGADEGAVQDSGRSQT